MNVSTQTEINQNHIINMILKKTPQELMNKNI